VNVLVAGGATGIGRACVSALRAQGHDVYVADINMTAAEEARSEAAPGRVIVGRHDLADPSGPRAAVESALHEFGRLDGLIVTAGVHLVAPVERYSIEDWERTMAVNVRAPFLFVQAAASALTKSKGSVVLTGSTAAFRGSTATFAYAASKGALISLTRSLAVELSSSGVRVNCVCPGWVDTPFNDPFWAVQDEPRVALNRLVERIPLGRQGDPQEVAGLMVYLLGREAAYITGQSIVVDGGLLSV
jgi:NAD(P)-dependent dehydrogenase (short-subunit alcohol dehydrogenase family)